MKEQDIKQIITDVLKAMEIAGEHEITLADDNVTWWANISTPEGHMFLARGGEGLLALNHVLKEMLRSKMPNKEAYVPLIVDINGFQKKHVDNLKTIAHMMAERARFFKSNISLDPMSPYDRRIIHEYLSESKDLKTESEGFGRDRHIVIKYIN